MVERDEINDMTRVNIIFDSSHVECDNRQQIINTSFNVSGNPFYN